MTRPPRLWELIAMAVDEATGKAPTESSPPWGRTVIEVEVKQLTEIMPLIGTVATVIGSAPSSSYGTVALVVEGLAVPKMPRAVVVCDRRYIDGAPALFFRFQEVA